MPTSTDMLPPNPPPTVPHEIRITRQVGPLGGPTRTYRDARIEAIEKSAVFSLVMPHHPYNGMNLGNWENIVRLIDAWLDTGTLPAPYVLKPKD